MNLVKTPGLLKRMYPRITWHIRDANPALYLTFDDGPTPGMTDGVLAELKRFNAKASFFCIGRNVERHPEIYNRIIGAGHVTGNHTYSHLKGWFTPDQEYFDDIRLASALIDSALYRPAYGMITPSQLKFLEASYHIILWDIMSYDFAFNTSPERCLRNVIRNVRPGSIVVFHDSVKASEKLLYALPRVLEFFTEKGWEFRSIPI